MEKLGNIYQQNKYYINATLIINVATLALSLAIFFALLFEEVGNGGLYVLVQLAAILLRILLTTMVGAIIAFVVVKMRKWDMTELVPHICKYTWYVNVALFICSTISIVVRLGATSGGMRTPY